MNTKLLCALLSLPFVVVTACAGDLEDPGRFSQSATSCGDFEVTVLAPRCATSGCHDSKSASGSLDLSGTGVRARLIGKAATGGGALVDPSAPDKSVLYEKLTASPPYGSRMPLGGALDANTLACAHAWIVGAPAATDAGADGSIVSAQDAAAQDAAHE